MKNTYLCAKCAIRQACQELEIANVSWDQRFEIMQEVLNIVTKKFKDGPSTNMGTDMHRYIQESAGRDIFVEIKKNGTEVSKNVLGQINSEIKTLKDACRAAIAANVIDFVTWGHNTNVEELLKYFKEPLAIDDFAKFEELLKDSKKILYLTDNCGEHIFDLVVIQKLEELGKEVVAAGKETYIMNDATVDDLKQAGFKNVISMGTNCIGTKFDEVSEEFKKEWDSADLIIAKGMGHYECLEDNPKRIVFMLRAKCEPVARALGIKKGDNVLKVK